MSRRILLGVGLLAGIGLTWLVGAGWGPNRVAGQQGHTPSPPSAAGELSTAPTAQDIAALDRTPPPLEGYSPIQICLSPDSRTAYVVNQTADSISVLDVASRAVQREIPVGRHPTHAVIAPDGQKLYVTCHYDYVVQELDLRTGQVVRQLPTGLEPTGLALSQDGRRLSVANTLSDSVTLLDLEQGVVRAETPVGRVPRYLAETADGRRLVVGEAHGRSVTILDPASGTVLESRTLGRSSQLRHVLCTPDGRWAITTLLVGHDEMVTVQMERGWINSNGFGVLDLQQPGHYVLLLLDEVLRGATNPWGLALSGDQQWLYVTLAGIHEVAIVDLPAVLELVSQTTPDQVPRLSQNVEILQQQQLARRVDVGGLLRCQIRLPEQMVEPHHGMDRRGELVTDVRQKPRLGPVRLLQPFHGMASSTLVGQDEQQDDDRGGEPGEEGIEPPRLLRDGLRKHESRVAQQIEDQRDDDPQHCPHETAPAEQKDRPDDEHQERTDVGQTQPARVVGGHARPGQRRSDQDRRRRLESPIPPELDEDPEDDSGAEEEHAAQRLAPVREV